MYPNSNSRTYLSTSTNKAQCETKYISSAIVVPTAIFTGHSCNHFFGNNNKAASFERSNKPKCTTPFMRPQRLPLCWIWEFVSHDFPQFITGGQGLWTQFFVLHIAYTTKYVYTYFSTKRPRTNINFTDIISAHGKFKSRQMKKCVGTWCYIEDARLLFLDKKVGSESLVIRE